MDMGVMNIGGAAMAMEPPQPPADESAGNSVELQAAQSLRFAGLTSFLMEEAAKVECCAGQYDLLMFARARAASKNWKRSSFSIFVGLE